MAFFSAPKAQKVLWILLGFRHLWLGRKTAGSQRVGAVGRRQFRTDYLPEWECRVPVGEQRVP